MTITRTFLVVAAAMAGLCAGPADSAPADPVVAEAIHALDAFCAAKAARQIDVISAAESDGYLPAGPELTAGMVQSGDMNTLARIKRIGKATVYLIATAPKSMGDDGPMPGAMADSCIVMVRGALPGLSPAVTEWVGLPGTEDGYLFVETPEGRKGPDQISEQAAEAASQAGGLRMVRVESGKAATGVTYVAVRPPAGPKANAVGGPLADFLEICVKDDAAGAEAAADAGRWMFAPGGDKDLPWPIKSGEARLRSTDDDFKVLFLGRAEAQLALTVVHVATYCAIGQAPPNDTVLIKDVEDWVGVAPVEIDPGGARIYLFTARDGVHTSLGDKWEKSLAAKMKAGPVYFVMLQRSSHSADFAVAGIGRVSKAVRL